MNKIAEQALEEIKDFVDKKVKEVRGYLLKTNEHTYENIKLLDEINDYIKTTVFFSYRKDREGDNNA